MKKLFFMAVLASTLVACEHKDKSTGLSNEVNYDNTAQNARDRDAQALTPMNQSENEVDRSITQRIRQALMADRSLSTDAKNIKIITINGVVTLRGPVVSEREKAAIINKLNEIQGIKTVDNHLDVLKNQ